MPLSSEDKQKYKSLYLQSAKPYIEQLKGIAQLNLDDQEAVETIHRAAHSMGSQSLMMEYNSIGQLSRLIERIFKAKIDDGYVITPAVLESLTKAVDGMQTSITTLETQDQETDLSQQIKELQTTSNITL